MKTDRTIARPAEGNRRNYWNNERKEALFGWAFTIPEIIGMLVLGVFPLFFSLYLSFTEWNLVGGLDAIEFVGFENYIKLFQDDKFYMSLKNNLLFTFVTIPVGMIMALVFAVLIHSKVLFKDYFKVAFFIPYISTQVALAAVWAALLHPSQGPVNQFLNAIGISDPPKWLGSTDHVMTAIIIIAVWNAIGYKIIIYLAGLSNIPHDIYEAAEIDGASFFQKFLRITIPLLGPTTFFLTITLLIGSFKVFDLIAFLSAGGPNSASTVLVFYIYEEGFRNFRMGYASALSWILFLIVGVLTVLTWKIQGREK